jgi:hypothetical protein
MMKDLHSDLPTHWETGKDLRKGILMVKMMDSLMGLPMHSVTEMEMRMDF